LNLPRADAALEICERHLSATNSFNTEIDAILAAYASAAIYSAFESEARAIVASRAAHPGADRHVVSFTRIAATRLMRSIKISELAGTAAFFDLSCKMRFQKALDDESKQAWDTVCGNRQGWPTRMATRQDRSSAISPLPKCRPSIQRRWQSSLSSGRLYNLSDRGRGDTRSKR